MINIEIAWPCIYCKRVGLIMSSDNILYCKWCRKKYGEHIEIKKKAKKNVRKTQPKKD